MPSTISDKALAAKASRLFQPMPFGNIRLQHRIIMPSLTRLRADANHVATPLMKEYYLQRACVPGTLLFAESCAVSPAHGGMPHSSAIFSDEQVIAWKNIVDAVHLKAASCTSSSAHLAALL